LLDIRKIELFVYDFDGVMTDNKVYINQKGEEMVKVNRGDGLAISEIKKMGFKQIIMSSEKNKVVSARAKKLKINVLQGIADKKDSLKSFCNEKNISLNKVAYVGNDINDKDAMELVGLTFCPSDAHEKIKTLSNYTFISKGGDGTIRELLDYILDNKGD